MRVSVTEAKGQLTELVRRAEAGDEVVLTRHGQPTVRLVPVRADRDGRSRRAILEMAQETAAAKLIPGPGAARSQDFLYDENGLPK
jgi:prevent-host-death family protein